MICKGTHPAMPSENIIVGGFCQNKFPHNIDLTPDNEYNISHTPGDFLFTAVEGKWMQFRERVSGAMLEVICDYECGGFISMGADFLSLSYSEEFAFNILAQAETKVISVQSVPPAPSNAIAQI